MNFDDTPQEAAFRAEAKAWIKANAPHEFEAELAKASLGRIKLQKHDIVEVAKAWQKKKAEAGWVCLHWPKEYGGRGASPVERVIWQQEEGIYFKLTSPFQIGEGMCGPTLMAFRQRSRQAALSAEDRLGRGNLVPVVLRARRRLRRRGFAHPRRTRWRSLGHQRPEDLDVGRALCRLRPSHHPHRSGRAQAQGPDHVLHRHEKSRASRSGRSSRPTACRNSTRCFSPICAFPTRSGWARSATAGTCR